MPGGKADGSTAGSQAAGCLIRLKLVRAAGLLNREVVACLRPLGLTDAQWRMMARLGEEDAGEGISQADLGADLRMNRSNVTGLVDRLEAQGLVARRACGDDRRVRRVALTEKGREAEECVAGRLDDLVEALAPAELARLADLLDQLSDAVDAALDGGFQVDGRSSGRDASIRGGGSAKS